MVPRTEEQNEIVREQRRAKLLQAAQQVFSRQGFHASKVADVAKEAKVSQGTVYHYYESKEALLMAVFSEWETENLKNEVGLVLQTKSTATERLALLAQAASERLSSSLRMIEASVEFWSHISRNTHIRKGFKHMFKQMAEDVAMVIQEGINAGEFQKVDATVMARLMIATYDGLILQWLADKNSIEWTKCTDLLVKVMLQGLVMHPEK